MQEQEAEIKKVTKAVDSQTGVLQKNASGWKMLMTGFAIRFTSEVVDGFKSIISTGLEASRVYEDMSAGRVSTLRTRRTYSFGFSR